MTSVGDIESPPITADSQLQDGIALARQDRREEARAIFRGMIQRNPEHEQAWLWLAWVAESREDARRYLEEARILLPKSVRIAEALRWAADATGSPGRRGRAVRTAAGAPLRGLASRLPGPEEWGRIVGGWRQAALSLVRGLAHAGHEGWEGLAAGSRRAAGVAGRLAGLPWERLRPMIAPTLTVLCIVALATGIMLLRRNVLADAARVIAETLPTPNPLATATPTAAQRAEPLWREVEVAVARGDWPAALASLERLRDLDPRDERVRRELAAVCLQHALTLIETNALTEAAEVLDRAVRADAASPGLADERRLLRLYLAGLDAYWTKDWKSVVSNLGKVQRLRPDYLDTPVMLGQGYYEYGVMLMGERKWFEAVDAMHACLELLPGHTEAPLRLADLEVAITPPRRIEVSLSGYAATLYEDDQPVRTFPICHGREGAPTLPGRYEIKTKLPSAYGSQWDLDMPYWLGLYDTGGAENGFHALPYLSSGVVLWEGAIGTRCSFGCIVLYTADAEYLYNWADLYTVVYIHP
jgi:tetratricopeptide (TPR) repeat protein